MRHYKYYKVNPFPLIVVLCLALSGNVMAGEKGKLRAIGFYNVENLFDGQPHKVKITILSPNGTVRAEKEYVISFVL